MESVNRRLIRPSLTELKEQMATRKTTPAQNKKAVPPDQTNAENYYYVKQMQSKTPMVIVMKDGEMLTGIIEWYDKGMSEVQPRRRSESADLQIEYQVYAQGLRGVAQARV